MSATVASDPKSSNRKSLQYGFVSFPDEAEMNRCYKEMNNKELLGKAITLSVQTQGIKNFDPLANVFVRNLAKEVTQNELYKMFEVFGPI